MRMRRSGFWKDGANNFFSHLTRSRLVAARVSHSEPSPTPLRCHGIATRRGIGINLLATVGHRGARQSVRRSRPDGLVLQTFPTGSTEKKAIPGNNGIRPPAIVGSGSGLVGGRCVASTQRRTIETLEMKSHRRHSAVSCGPPSNKFYANNRTHTERPCFAFCGGLTYLPGSND
jgi:hypothetical protein